MSEQRPEYVIVSAERFFSHRKVHEVLQDWGEQLRQWDDNVPEGWGWPGHSIDCSQQYASMSTGMGMTLPEACVDLLRTRGKNIQLVNILISGLPMIPSASLKLRYVYQLEETSIAVQLGTSQRVIQQCLSDGRNAVRRSLIQLRERIKLPRYLAKAI